KNSAGPGDVALIATAIPISRGAKNSSAPLAAAISKTRLTIDDDGSFRATRRERRRPLCARSALPPANSTGRTDIWVRSLRIGVTLFRSKLAVTIEAMTLLSAGTGLDR